MHAGARRPDRRAGAGSAASPLRAGLLPLFFAFACLARPDASIAPAELAREIEAGSAPVIVDVRSNGEYTAGHVPGAIHLPFLEAEARAGEIPGERDAPVVVYCEHGPRARIAAGKLRDAGFSHIVALEGHMSGWREAGLPVEGAEQSGDP